MRYLKDVKSLSSVVVRAVELGRQEGGQKAGPRGCQGNEGTMA